MYKSRGGALIIAILAVALVTASATWLLRGQSLWLAQTETQLTLGQGKQLLLTGMDWAMVILAEDARNSQIDHHSEIWAKPLPPSTVEDWKIEGGIEDAQSRFNLNNLVRDGKVSPPDQRVFTEILRLAACPPDLLVALTDWLDEDSEGNIEDATYLQQFPPYRNANRPLHDLGELIKIRGFNPSVIDRLKPYVNALPGRTPLNINTTSATLLMSLIPGLTASEAQQLLSRRDQSPFTTMSDVKSRLPRADLTLPESELSLDSRYFRIFGSATNGEKRIGLEALISRKNPLKPQIIWKRET